jgi:signal transduction histidine kinase
VEARHVEGLLETQRRLVLTADAERRRIERELHEGVQQQLAALAVELQLASAALEAEPGTAKVALDGIARDLQHALDETARLALRIYPPLLEAGGLAAALRAAAVAAGVHASVEVASRADYPPEIARTVYWCWLWALDRADTDARPAISTRDEGQALAFELEVGADAVEPELECLRDRVEALGGTLTIRLEAGRARVSGSLPLA